MLAIFFRETMLNFSNINGGKSLRKSLQIVGGSVGLKVS